MSAGIMAKNMVERGAGATSVPSAALPDVVSAGYSTSPSTHRRDAKGRIIEVFEAWDTGVPYLNLDVAIGSDSLAYRSQQAGNQGNDPTTDTAGTWWKPDNPAREDFVGDGAVVSVTLAKPYHFIMVFLNGVLLTAGKTVGDSYAVSGTGNKTVTFKQDNVNRTLELDDDISVIRF